MKKKFFEIKICAKFWLSGASHTKVLRGRTRATFPNIMIRIIIHDFLKMGLVIYFLNSEIPKLRPFETWRSYHVIFNEIKLKFNFSK